MNTGWSELLYACRMTRVFFLTAMEDMTNAPNPRNLHSIRW
jgi:hypothetical protein